MIYYYINTIDVGLPGKSAESSQEKLNYSSCPAVETTQLLDI